MSIRDEDGQDQFLAAVEDAIHGIRASVFKLLEPPAIEGVNRETGFKTKDLVTGEVEDTGERAEDVPVSYARLLENQKAKKYISTLLSRLLDVLEEAKPVKTYTVRGGVVVTHSFAVTLKGRSEDEVTEQVYNMDAEALSEGNAYADGLEDIQCEVDYAEIDVQDVEVTG